MKLIPTTAMLICVLLLSSCGQGQNLQGGSYDLAFCDNYAKLDVTIAHDDGTETDTVTLQGK